MTIKRYVAVVLLAACCLTGYAQGEAVFNIATYNIRQLNKDDNKNGNGWKRRCPVLGQLVRFHEFDIFGTQEGFKSQLEDLKAQLPGYEYTGIGREDGKEKGEHSAIFYNTDIFELLDHGDFWLSETPDRPGLGWDAACPRICSWGKFRHKPSGKVFQYFNLHLDHVGETARVESVKLVMRKMKELGGDIPTFLSGDFNVDQTHASYRELAESGKLVDSYTVSPLVYALNGTFNSYHTDRFTDSRIDHIFVTPDVAVIKYGVLTDTYRTAEYYDAPEQAANAPEGLKVTRYCPRVPSDHFPVLIKVHLRD